MSCEKRSKAVFLGLGKLQAGAYHFIGLNLGSANWT